MPRPGKSSSSKHKSGKSYKTEWSSWQWDEEWEAYFKYRYNSEGALEYRWSKVPDNQGPQEPDDMDDAIRTPRHTGIDPATQGLSQLSLSTSPDETQHGAHYTHTHEDPKGKGKAIDSQHQGTYIEGDQEDYLSQSAQTVGSSHFGDDEGESSEDDATTETGSNYPQSSVYSEATAGSAAYDQYVQASVGGYPAGYSGGYNPNPELRFSLNTSQSYHTGPSGSQYYQPEMGEPSQVPMAAQDATDPSHYALNSNYGQPGGEEDTLISNHYQSSNPPQFRGESLQGDYEVCHSRYFEPGMILKTPWSEPMGQKDQELISEGRPTKKEGQPIYTGIRRFIVIGTDAGHSHCVPILTYEGRACTKKGVKPQKHGIIYDDQAKPRLVSKEPDLGFKPVRAIMTKEGETLAKASRVNYSKAFTIEHNLHVMFIGYVNQKDFATVQKAHNECYDSMNFKYGGGSSSRHHHHHRRHHK